MHLFFWAGYNSFVTYLTVNYLFEYSIQFICLKNKKRIKDLRNEKHNITFEKKKII